MRQLCSHFAHKVPASCDDASGWIEFPFGHCRLAVDDSSLLLTAEAENPEDLDRLEGVIARHLARFAWRETPDVVWVALNA